MLIHRIFQINNRYLKHFVPIFVRGENDSEGVIE